MDASMKAKKNKDDVLILESINHWKKMINWVAGQPQNSKPNFLTMLVNIGENWGSMDCPFCKYYVYIDDWKPWLRDCIGCPISQKWGRCSVYKKSHPWGAVSNSSTWGEWLINAELFLKELEKLLQKNKD